MRTRLCLAAAALTAALALSGCSSSDSSDTSDSGDSKPSAESTKQDADTADTGADKADATKDVKITKSGVENHDVWGPNAYVIHYTITNNGKEPADYFAQFEFLDKDGDVLGSTGVTADKLGPGKSKTADAAPVKAEIENGTMADITSVRVSQVDRT